MKDDEIRKALEGYLKNDPYGTIHPDERIACVVDYQAGWEDGNKFGTGSGYKEVEELKRQNKIAVEALEPFLKEGFNCAGFIPDGSCQKSCSIKKDCRFLNAYTALSQINESGGE